MRPTVRPSSVVRSCQHLDVETKFFYPVQHQRQPTRVESESRVPDWLHRLTRRRNEAAMKSAARRVSPGGFDVSMRT